MPFCGDANYNESLEAGDALVTLRIAVGVDTCDPVATSCDPNADGVVTPTDALTILRAVTGLPANLQCSIPCMP